MALNQITIQGRMTRDAEEKNTPSGKAVTVFCVACQRNYKNTEGKYETDFIDCVANDKIGDFIRKFFCKGSEIIVSGELTTRTYDDKNGVKHKVATIIVNKAYFVGNGNQNQGSTQATAQNSPSEATPTSDNNELPFAQ